VINRYPSKTNQTAKTTVESYLNSSGEVSFPFSLKNYDILRQREYNEDGQELQE
jgi:hypothetical protein